MLEERLQKKLSKAVLSSRREAEILPKDGIFSVNGGTASIGDKSRLSNPCDHTRGTSHII